MSDQFELECAPVTRTQIVRFAGAGGDFNPMHHDEEFARASGQPSVFAMGQLQAAMLARMASDWLGAANLRSLEVRFTAKVWPGDVLTLHGTVTERVIIDGHAHVRCTLQARRARSGDVVARGAAVARVDGTSDPVHARTET